MDNRKGLTLVELLVSLAIIAVLLALLLAGVQAARQVAVRLKSQNKMRQIMLTTHHFAAIHDDRLPSVDGNEDSANPGVSFFGSLYDLMERAQVTFVSPADPSVGPLDQLGGCSYAANAQLFWGNPSLRFSIPDGTANTIAVAEHYARNCQGFNFHWALPITAGIQRRATFADRGAGDIIPVTNGVPPTSGPSFPGLTFQVAPTPFETKCFPLIPQTPHRAGMLVALVDGSSRVISPGIDSSVFWGAVTPGGGEGLPGW